jgi:hypothetical protein
MTFRRISTRWPQPLGHLVENSWSVCRKWIWLFITDLYTVFLPLIETGDNMCLLGVLICTRDPNVTQVHVLDWAMHYQIGSPAPAKLPTVMYEWWFAQFLLPKSPLLLLAITHNFCVYRWRSRGQPKTCNIAITCSILPEITIYLHETGIHRPPIIIWLDNSE